MTLDEIKEIFRQGKYLISGHCRKRMQERGFAVKDILHCVSCGAIIERQEHGRDEKVVIAGRKVDGEECYVVVALSSPELVVVTVCYFHNEVWEGQASDRRRR